MSIKLHLLKMCYKVSNSTHPKGFTEHVFSKVGIQHYLKDELQTISFHLMMMHFKLQTWHLFRRQLHFLQDVCS